ncbi:MAG: T9SS type A sorting domain-containing protein [Flavobacteriales bacterium]
MRKPKFAQRLMLMFVFLLSIFQLSAQNPGDIVFIGLQTQPSSIFSIIVINPIAPNTVIRFTDNAWDGSNLASNESVMTWTSPGSTLNTGTIIRFTDSGAANAQVSGGGSANGKLANLSGGDQILAFTGTVGTPSFIAAISTKNFLPVCGADNGDTTTCLPAPLSIGQNAIAFTNSAEELFENGFFSTINFVGTAEEMRLAVTNVNYWTRNDDPQIAGVSMWPAWNFSVGTPFPSSVRFLQNAITIQEGAVPSAIQLQLNFPQPIPQIIRMNVLHFGSASPADYTTNPPVINNVLEINVAPNQTNISFSIQAILDGIPEPDEVVSFTLANLTSGLSIGTPSTCVVTIQNVDQNFSQLSFATDTYNVVEGNEVDVVININPPAPMQQTIGINIQNGAGIDATDYLLSPAPIGSLLSLNVPIGATSVSFRFIALDDQEAENNETVQFIISEFSPVFQAVSPSITIVSIIDNDSPVIVIPNFQFNELMPVNTNTIQDPFGQFDPWIEIYNLGEFASLSNLYISDVSSNPTKFRFPVVGSNVLDINAAGFRLIWADATTSQGPIHTNFTLNPNGGFLSLYAEDGVTLIDSISYPAIAAGLSFGRSTEGSAQWQIFNSPTPGAANVDTVPTKVGTLSKASIEIFPNPATDQLFIRFDREQDLNGALVSVIDLNGRAVLQKNIYQNTSNIQSIHLKSLQSGMYILQIEQAEEKRLLRFVKN